MVVDARALDVAPTAAVGAPGKPPLIRLRGVTKTFGEGAAAFQALSGVDLDVASGDFVAVMGASGSGKSTMMNILGCLDVPTDGRVPVHGRARRAADRDQRALLRRRYLGFVFQGFNLLARTSALENVELPLLYRGEPTRARHEAAMAALDRSAWPTGGSTRRRNSRAASSSASRSPAPSSPTPPCCSPTSRPATSTASDRSRSWSC